MILRKVLILLMFVGISSSASAQQPWVKDPGKGYWQTGFTVFHYGRVYNSPTDFQKIARTVTEMILSQYVEYGLLKRLMLTAQIPVHIVRTGDISDGWVLPTLPKGSLIGFGNIYTALTLNLVQKGGFVFSTSFGTYFNSSNRDYGPGLQTGCNGTGFEPKLLVGLGREKQFYALGAGVNFRTNSYSHQLKIDAKWGSRMGKKKRGWFIVGLTNCIPLNKNDAATNFILDFTTEETYLYRNEQAYIGFNLTWGLELEKWSGWLSFGGGPGWKVGQSAPISLSIGRKFGRKLKEPKNKTPGGYLPYKD